jgi:hypothetical protein
MEALQAQVKEMREAMDKAAVATTTAIPAGPRSYATAAAAAVPATAAQVAVLARDVCKRKQILVDKASDATVDALASLSELELKEKANLALTLMASKMEGAMFVGAKKLENGGVVYDCKMEEMAVWVRGEAVMKEFVAAMGGSCVYRPRSIQLIAEMVPVEMRVEDAGTWRVVEGESGLTTGVIVSARWVKALERRAQNQKVAHLKVEFLDAEAANHAIDYGLYWQGRNFCIRKNDEEPQRCMKCQKFDAHLAYACKSAVDVCGRCAENHRTVNCPVTDSGLKRCSNCKVSGHAAVDRTCPFFQKEVQRKRARDPTMGYHYVPTADPKTWATTPAAPVAQASDSQVPEWRTTGGQGRLAGGAAGQGGGVAANDEGRWGFRGGRPPTTGANSVLTGGLRQTLIPNAFQQGETARGRGMPAMRGAARGRGGPGPSPLGGAPTGGADWYEESERARAAAFLDAAAERLKAAAQQQQDPAATVGGAI